MSANMTDKERMQSKRRQVIISMTKHDWQARTGNWHAVLTALRPFGSVHQNNTLH